MQIIELELTYLAKRLPQGLRDCPSKQIVDCYFPVSAEHPTLRLRRSGDAFEMTKKLMAEGTDSSNMIEHTIDLDAAEYADIAKAGGKRVAKRRYYYRFDGRQAEIDVFEGDLQGLVLVDFEFTNREEQLQFQLPDFCLADVTQEAFIAGGVLAGKSYADIRAQLEKYGYRTLYLHEDDD